VVRKTTSRRPGRPQEMTDHFASIRKEAESSHDEAGGREKKQEGPMKREKMKLGASTAPAPRGGGGGKREMAPGAEEEGCSAPLRIAGYDFRRPERNRGDQSISNASVG